MFITFALLAQLAEPPKCSFALESMGIPLYSGIQVQEQKFKLKKKSLPPIQGTDAPKPKKNQKVAECTMPEGTLSLQAFTADGLIHVAATIVTSDDATDSFWLVVSGPIPYEEVVSNWVLTQQDEISAVGEFNLGLQPLDLRPGLSLEMMNVPDALAEDLANVKSDVIVVKSQDSGRAATKATFLVPPPLMTHVWSLQAIRGVDLVEKDTNQQHFEVVSGPTPYKVEPGGFSLLGTSHSSVPVLGTFDLAANHHQMKLQIELASGVGRVSVPVPVLAPFFQVSCPRRGVRPDQRWWTIEGGEVIDIDDVTIDGNLCKLVLQPSFVVQTILNANSISVAEGISRSGGVKECKKSTGRGAERGRCATKTDGFSQESKTVVHGKAVYTVKDAQISSLTHTDLDAECSRLYPGDPGQVCVFLSDADASKAKGLLALYGDQIFNIVVSETRNGKVGETWTSESNTLSLDTAVWEHTLKLPSKTNDTNVVYEVAVLSITPGVPEQAAESIVVGRLRPRGLFGIPSWKAQKLGWRMYLTVPVNALGIRAKASGLDLKSSSDNPNLQLAVLETGLLFVVEPWSYIRARNSSPIPLYVAGGVTFSTLDVDAGVVNPHFVFGGGLSLPLVTGTSQLDTSLTLGVYWNVDLRRSHPFAEGNHALFTVGTNALSIFGAQSAKD